MKSLFFFSLALSLLFFSIGLFTLKDYGINWDEPTHFTRGQAILRLFVTGQKDYKTLDRSKDRVSIYQQEAGPGRTAYGYLLSRPGHPPLNGTLASFFNYIFYQKLGILDDIESYHLFIVFTSALLAFLIFFFTAKEYGLFAGLIAYLSLVLYPLFLGESHYNIKDPVETAFYSLTIYFVYRGITKNSVWFILLASIVAGFALSTKFNILFVFIPLFVWLIFYKWMAIKNIKWLFPRSLTITCIISFFIPWLVLIASWPYLWSNTFSNLLQVFNYYKGIGGTVWQPNTYLFLGFNIYSAEWIFYTTPIPVLLLCLSGIIYVLKQGLNENKKTSILILIWFLTPIFRVSLPHTGIYGGVRQIMEFVPAMAILAGIGANYIIQLSNCSIVRIVKSFRIKYIIQFLIIFSFLPITLKLISIHPNEAVYFNELAGGLKGAYEKEILSAGSDLGNVYRQGANWLDLNAKKNAKLSLAVNGVSAVPRPFLRKDIVFSNDFWSDEKSTEEYIMNTTEVGWDLIFPEKSDYLRGLKPVFEVKVDGASILKIWKKF